MQGIRARTRELMSMSRNLQVISASEVRGKMASYGPYVVVFFQISSGLRFAAFWREIQTWRGLLPGPELCQVMQRLRQSSWPQGARFSLPEEPVLCKLLFSFFAGSREIRAGCAIKAINRKAHGTSSRKKPWTGLLFSLAYASKKGYRTVIREYMWSTVRT